MAAAAALARMELKPKAKAAASQEAIRNQGGDTGLRGDGGTSWDGGNSGPILVWNGSALQDVLGLERLPGCHRNVGDTRPWALKLGMEHPGGRLRHCGV